MAENDEILESMQSDIFGLLQNAPKIKGHVLKDNEKDFQSRLEKSLGTKSAGVDGKRGLAIIVLQVDVTEAEKNLPGPPLQLRARVLILENIVVNRSVTKGTLQRSSQAALNILSVLHLAGFGGYSIYADKNPIAPQNSPDGISSHIVTLFCRVNGLCVVAKPLPVMVEMITPAAVPEGQIRFQDPASTIDVLLVPAGAYNGTDSWSKTGSQTPETGPWWTIQKVNIGPLGKWLFSWAPDGLAPLVDNVTVLSDSAAVLPIEDSTWPSGASVEVMVAEGSGVLTITGSLTMGGNPIVFPPLVEYPDFGGVKPFYSDSGDYSGANMRMQWYVDDGGFWLLDYEGGAAWISTEDVATPNLVTTWALAPDFNGGGTPSVALAIIPATASIALTCDSPGASIRYTTDGSYPSPAKTLYTAPFAVPATGTVIRAAAFIPDQPPGDVLEFTITE